MSSSASYNKTILLVEDEVIVALSQKMEMEKRGYSVITASSGKDAIEAFKSNRSIDLILMDIDLGSGIDGTETAELILQERDIPIVFLSSHTEPEIVEKTEKITSYGYVVKNSSITVLDASIKMAFRLFNEKKRVLEHQQKLKHTNEQLEKSQELILERENKLRESEDRYRSI
ncbi:MAG TPA: response regulator, partial [Spirochaetota bacterium]|nr:response regulator [Spirochaetota bacterium]